MTGPGSGSNFEIFLRSLALVGVAELFDKTWFMGLIFALRYGARLVFLGSFAALFLHCFLAAALGLTFARFLSQVALSYLTAALFFTFACMYAKDWYTADPEADAIEAGKEEASGACTIGAAEGSTTTTVNGDRFDGLSTVDTEADETDVMMLEEAGSAKRSQDDPKPPGAGTDAAAATDWAVVAKSFMAVFIAEWGDRTQIAMIGQHASQPLIPVFLGSVAAFFWLTLSAVGAATLLAGHKLRERVVFGFSACCFLVFGLLALKDAIALSSGAPGDS